MSKVSNISILSLLALSACQSATPTVRPPEIGWTPYPTVRAFDPPGRIIRKEPNGAIFGVGSINLVNPNCGGPEATPAVKKDAKFVIGNVLETIGVAKEALPATFNADLSRTATYDVESIDGIRECLDDADIDPIISSIAGFFEQNRIMVRPDNEYFLIRETFATRKLKFTSEKAWLGNLGLDAQFQQQVSNKAKLEWGNGTKYSIDKTFDQPMRVWYRAQKLTITPATGAGPGQVSVALAGYTDQQLIPSQLPNVP